MFKKIIILGIAISLSILNSFCQAQESELNTLIENINSKILEISPEYPWLSSYGNNQIQDKNKRSIFYMPLLPSSDTIPAQPDQLFIRYDVMTDNYSFDIPHSNDQTNLIFPALNMKLYAKILIRGKENEELRKKIINIIIKEYNKLKNNAK